MRNWFLSCYGTIYIFAEVPLPEIHKLLMLIKLYIPKNYFRKLVMQNIQVCIIHIEKPAVVLLAMWIASSLVLNFKSVQQVQLPFIQTDAWLTVPLGATSRSASLKFMESTVTPSSRDIYRNEVVSKQRYSPLTDVIPFKCQSTSFSRSQQNLPLISFQQQLNLWMWSSLPE